jgi:hypothetical protein
MSCIKPATATMEDHRHPPLSRQSKNILSRRDSVRLRSQWARAAWERNIKGGGRILAAAEKDLSGLTCPLRGGS